MTTAQVPGAFGIVLELDEARAVLRVRGELDLLTAPDVEAVLMAALGEDLQVVVDIAEVRFLDAVFLAVLARAARELQSSGRRLTLRSADGFQRRLLAITGLDRVIVVEPAHEQLPAVAGLARAAALPADRAVLEAALRLVVSVAHATVRTADGASISLARHGRLRTVAATDRIVSGMDEDQYATGQGPCVDAAEHGRGVYVPAVTEEARWPDFVPLARERGIRSILSTPLGASGTPTGALNIYSFTDRAFAEREQQLAAVFATGVTELLLHAGLEVTDQDVASRLRDALTVRETVAVAQGILMGRDGGSAYEAYRRLLRHSRRTGQPLRELAADVVATVSTPNPVIPSDGASEGGTHDPIVG